jgi:CubicO group peptidase (beta-lactamase class C family)
MEFRKILLCGVLCMLGHGAMAKQEANVAAKAAAPAAAPMMALDKSNLDTWLDGYMPFALQTSDIPGAVVVVVKDGKILTARGFGYADVEKRTPVDPEKTLFRPGSVSKLVTWTAVMQQVELKKLDLDADVNTYLDFKIATRAGAPVTLRQIMTHTAGFEEAAKNIIFYDATRQLSLGDGLKAWVPARIYDAGTTPAYSNYATALAGYVVERVSGEKFDDYVERHIFSPLGMNNSSFRQPLPAGLAPQMATGYGKGGAPAPGFEIVGPAPAGSMSASGTDMGRYMIANLQNGELDGKRIFSEATAATMFDSPLDKINPKSLIAPLNRMELGFFETNINGRSVIGHLGDTVAFHTSLHLFMKEGVGFYLSVNSGGKAGASNTLRSALFQDFADRYFDDISPKDGLVDPKVAAEHARLMSGNWQASRRSDSSFFSFIGLLGQTKVDVGAKGELIIPSLTGRNGRPREWVEVAPYVWRDKNGNDRLAAQVVDGQPVRWSMDFMSPFIVMDRVPAARSGVWLMPALYTAVGVMLLTLLSWPFGWYLRRKYKTVYPLAGPAKRAYKGTQLMSGLSLLVLGGWGGAIGMMMSSIKNATSALDALLWLLQGAGGLVFVAAILISAWNMKLTCTDGRNWARKLWSVLLFASSLVMLYVALNFGLLAFSVNY